MFRIFLLLTALCGLVPHIVSGDRITGNVFLNGNGVGTSSLPSGSIMEIQVLDTTLADAMARVLASERVPVTGSLPISYQIVYTPDSPPLPSYTLSAAITNGNRLLYRNTESVTTTVQENGVDFVNIPVDAIA